MPSTHGQGWVALSTFFMSALTAISLAGCGTVKQTGTARTGTEQLLLTNAWDRALQKVDFRPLTGVPVYLDTTNVNAVDQGWVVSSLRESMLTQGVLLKPKQEQAQYIVEARVGAYGTDAYNWMFGIPQTTIPQTITGLPAGTIPEMSFAKSSDQHAVAKLALFAYDRTSGQLVWNSGTQIDQSNAKDRYIGGLGPIQSGTIRGGTEFVGIKVPLGADAEVDPKQKRSWWRRNKDNANAKSEDLPPMSKSDASMAAKSDLDSFKP
jgi:hypothetical protein